MLKWSAIGAAHWFVFIGFYGLFLTWSRPSARCWNPAFHLPLIGEWFLWNLFADIIGTGTILGILYLIYRRQQRPPAPAGPARAASPGRNEGRGYFVEAVVLTVGICILLIRALKISSRPDRRAVLVAPGLRRAGAPRCPTTPTCSSVVAFVKIVVIAGLAGRDQPDPEHGRRLAPVQRLLQHLLQAQRRRRRRARPAAGR